MRGLGHEHTNWNDRTIIAVSCCAMWFGDGVGDYFTSRDVDSGSGKKDGVDRTGAFVAHFQDDFTFTLAGNGSVSVWIKDDREPSSHINNLNGRILVFASGAVPTGSNTTGTDLSFTVTGLSGGIGAPVYTLRVAGDPTNNTPKYICLLYTSPSPRD